VFWFIVVSGLAAAELQSQAERCHRRLSILDLSPLALSRRLIR
jgi:hypothetical protein